MLRDPNGVQALAVRHRPYWERVEPNLYLGCYKGPRGSTWLARKFIGNGKYRQARLGTWGDAPCAMDYRDALRALRIWASQVEQAPDEVRARHAPRRRDLYDLQPGRLDHIARQWAGERPDLDFWAMGFLLRVEYAHALHERRIAALAKNFGLQLGDLHVLLALRRNGTDGAIPPEDLHRDVLVSAGAITRRLNRLVSMRLIVRVARDGDPRLVPVRLTRKGKRLSDDALDRIHSTLRTLVECSGLSPEQLEDTDVCFRRLLAAMQLAQRNSSGEPA